MAGQDFEQINIKNALIGLGSALPLAIPVDLLIGGQAALVTGLVAGVGAYVYGDEIWSFVQSHLPAMQDAEALRRYLLSVPGQQRDGVSADTQQTTILQERLRQSINDDTPQLDRQEEEWDFENDDEIVLPTRRSASSLFTLSDVLKDFTPSLKHIYLGEREDGSPVFCSASKLFHIALAGKSGRGKGSLMRLLLAQLCALHLDVILLNPHYAPWVYTDSGMDEDWTPFLPYLKRDPLECVETPDIEALLRWCVEVLLEKRKAKFRSGQRPGKPFFIVIDELPAIIDESKKCANYISKLLNQGRKYGIFMIVASQNFQVKSVSGDTSGADRENYETGYYVGGDSTTAKVLLDMLANQIPETELGRGVAMLRCAGSPEAEKAVKVRVPFTDNEALYRLLGPSTFKQNDEPHTDDLSEIGRMFEELQRQTVEAFQPREEEKPLPTPVIQEKGPKADEIELAVAIAAWNAGYNSEDKLMRAFPGLTKYQAGKLRDRIVPPTPVNE